MTAPLTQAYYPPSGAGRAQSHLGQEMSAERGAGQGWAAATVVIPATDTLYILLCSQGETETRTTDLVNKLLIISTAETELA